MRQIKTQEHYTRRQLIADCVNSYIRNNPQEYLLFLENVKDRRASLYDKKFGEFAEDKMIGSSDGFRVAFTIPNKLYGAITEILRLHNEPGLGDVKGEMKWFSKEFNQFLIPNTY